MATGCRDLLFLPPSARGPLGLGSYRDQVDYSNFQVGVELVTWDNSLNQAFGLLLRVNSLFLGGTEGYTATYDNSSGDLQINRVLGEAPSELGATVYLLDPASEPYRLSRRGIQLADGGAHFPVVGSQHANHGGDC